MRLSRGPNLFGATLGAIEQKSWGAELRAGLRRHGICRPPHASRLPYEGASCDHIVAKSGGTHVIVRGERSWSRGTRRSERTRAKFP